jgi:hypothetical protein
MVHPAENGPRSHMTTHPLTFTERLLDNPGSLLYVCFFFPDRLITRECSAPIIKRRMTII